MIDISKIKRGDKVKERNAVLILAAILEMSDRAEKLGGASCISGVASLHAMQTSIQKNRKRVIELLGDLS